MSYSLNSLIGGYIGDYIGEPYRVRKGDTRSLNNNFITHVVGRNVRTLFNCVLNMYYIGTWTLWVVHLPVFPQNCMGPEEAARSERCYVQPPGYGWICN